MSFTHEESEIIRDADMDGTLKTTQPEAYVNQMLDMVLDLQEKPEWHNAEWAIGNLGVSLIQLCAKLDLDLTTCIRKARKQ